MLKFALMVQKQMWIKLLVLECERGSGISCNRSHWLCFSPPHTCRQKKPVWLKNVFDEAEEMIQCIKYWALSACLFNILVLCDKVGKCIKQFCCELKYEGRLEDKDSCDRLHCELSEPLFFMEYYSYFKDRQRGVIQIWAFGRPSFENEWNELTTSRKNDWQ